jgi:hypothetical protein
MVRKICRKLAERHSIELNPVPHFIIKRSAPLVLKTLFTQLILERGILASTVYYVLYAC